MTRLIDDLLSLLRIELSGHTRPTDLVELDAILHRTIELLGRPAKRHGSEIFLDLAADLPRTIADSSELSHVFNNLSTNTLKCCGEKSKVNITSTVSQTRPLSMLRSGPCLKVSTRDYG
jgi:signal transduction histidine kinase